MGPTGTGWPARTSCAGWSRTTCANSAGTTSIWSTCASTGLASIAEHLGALAELREAGLIRHLGLSNVRDAHLDEAVAIAPVVAVQNRYGIGFGRVNDDLVRATAELGLAFVPFFAIAAEGREEGGVAATDAVLEVARAHDATPAQVRLAWTLHGEFSSRSHDRRLGCRA